MLCQLPSRFPLAVARSGPVQIEITWPPFVRADALGAAAEIHYRLRLQTVGQVPCRSAPLGQGSEFQVTDGLLPPEFGAPLFPHTLAHFGQTAATVGETLGTGREETSRTQEYGYKKAELGHRVFLFAD